MELLVTGAAVEVVPRPVVRRLGHLDELDDALALHPAVAFDVDRQ
ncbi:hypothetical protein [Salinigranum sp.]